MSLCLPLLQISVWNAGIDLVAAWCGWGAVGSLYIRRFGNVYEGNEPPEPEPLNTRALTLQLCYDVWHEHAEQYLDQCSRYI